ncbi:hypothetical protein CROQUDRAFT_76332 [Cronartium quercuum f. sp. fusiforme G11]|uniref:Secreted protein n=1 Tax=Cronartium quercuum f. sp. fusiforme G11 TaxID=708437 RepID=A0A9P6NIL6_9BASI|nr:hypothetical protein CROQUDRAFT_76332 [Cronartium quercuum f. sp. fusiforme G11]
MTPTSLFFLLFVAYVQAIASNNTGCYDYFLHKDGCVWASNSNPCPLNSPAGKPCTSLRAFQHNQMPPPPPSDQMPPSPPSDAGTQTDEADGASDSETPKRLVRRYDTTQATKAVAGGRGICGYYDTNTTSGVCLWSGTNWVDGSDPSTSGWLDGAETRNCGKQVYIQLQGRPETVQYANVLDGCNFATHDPNVGCFQIYLTIDLFKKFNPTDQELANYTMNALFSWDFNNESGNNNCSGPA